ncbi:MAG TPA: hypothetical protein VI670_22485 [Thermoanaerobaculia bacterium]
MIYRKWGRVVRWENGTLVRVEEAGEAREENGVFFAQPIAERVALPEVDAGWVIETARAIGEAERVIVTHGVALHEYGDVRWPEETRRVHVALIRKPWRVLVDDVDVATVRNALARCEGERDFEHLLVPAHIASPLLECGGHAAAVGASARLEQLAGGRDGYGRPIERHRVDGEPPNFYRPSYRVRPVRRWMNVRAIPSGTVQAAPKVLALVDGGKALVDDGGRVFVTPLRPDMLL